MKPTTQLIAVIMLTRPEAATLNKEIKDDLKQIRESVEASAPKILEMNLRQGYVALGYSTWKEYVEQELDVSERYAYRLLDQAKTQLVLGEWIPEAHARVLKDVRDEDKPQAYAMAQAAAREAGAGGAVTVHHLRVAIAALPPPPVDETVNAGGTTDNTSDTHTAGSSSNSAPTPGKGTSSGGSGTGGGSEPKKPAPAKDAEKHDTALARIGKICGRSVKAAIEEETVKLTRKEAIYWGNLKDEDMVAIQELVLTKRWAPSKCIGFINKMPTGNTRVADLQNICIGAGGKAEVTVNQFGLFILNQGMLLRYGAAIRKLLGIS